MRLDVAAIQQRIDAQPARRRSPCARSRSLGAVDLLATYGTRGSDMQSWLAGAPVNRDFSLKLEYISGLALNAERSRPDLREHDGGSSLSGRDVLGSRSVEAGAERAAAQFRGGV